MAKVYLIVFFQVFSFILIAISCYHSDINAYFFVALFACIFTGAAQGFGEATFLGFIKEFPTHMVGYVSSGTGFAGIMGTLLLLIFN
jgi:hypothetical protein